MCNRGQRGPAARRIVAPIMDCYCGQPAVLRIPAAPEAVCRAHAIEFWTGLLAFTRARTEVRESQTLRCLCLTCNQLSASRDGLIPHERVA